MPPLISHLTEAALYVADLDQTEAFYTGILGLKKIGRTDGRGVLFQAGPAQMLLCFLAKETLKGDHLPAHGAEGAGHIALGIAASDFNAWKEHLRKNGIAIEHEHHWERGGRSLYFRDPAGNAIELATPGIWGLASGW
jgi:catechol 2,3-dioxygenase-like lactoylglutathione lyase family enzyme